MRNAEKIYKKWLSQYGGGYSFLKMDFIKKFYPLANKYKVSEKARGLVKPKTSDKGFLQVYSKVKNPNKLKNCPVKKSKPDGANWFKTRENRLNAKIGQMKSMNIKYFDKDGVPTKMHVILIMWAYSPYVNKLKKYLSTI